MRRETGPVSSGVRSSFGFTRVLSRLLCPVEVKGLVMICRCRFALLYAPRKLEATARVVLGVLPEF